MEERAELDDVQRTMLRTIVPFGFVNVVALLFSPVMLAVIADDWVDTNAMQLWAVAVWFGAALQLIVLLCRRTWLQHKPTAWERAYGWVEVYIGAAWGAALAVPVIDGDPLTYHLLVLCFLLVCTAVAVVAFAGAPTIARRFLAGLWVTTIVIGVRGRFVEIVGLATFVWPMALAYLTFATRLLRRSVVEQHRSNELSRDLAIQASTDGLTGLLNRRATLQRVQQHIDRGDGITALFMDLDGFKEVNDHYGHAAGDTVLINVANQLRTVARADDVVGRIGGDEFVVLLTEQADQDLADVIAARFAGEIARSHGAIHELAVTASVGAARSMDGVTAEDLLGCADAAMYRAKAQGGNTAVHYLSPHPD